MAEKIRVGIVELSDRYLVVDFETRENVEFDAIGFEYADAAAAWAKHHDYEIVEVEK